MPVRVIGVPLDLGAARRGTDMGPSAIRCARLAEVLMALGQGVCDEGDLAVPLRREPSAAMGHLAVVAAVCDALAGAVAGAVGGGAVPLVLGGDHSVAIGTIGGLLRAGRAPGVLWLDAHGDFNTPETSPSGNIHGMPLAVACGEGSPQLLAISGGRAVDPRHCALVGVRSLDPVERDRLRGSGLAVFTMRMIDEQGMAAVMRQAIGLATGGGRRPLHLSVDLDVVDPVHAPGVGTPVAGGVTYREAQLAMELVADSSLLGSLELVECNPILDEHNRTAALAVALAASAFGQRID